MTIPFIIRTAYPSILPAQSKKLLGQDYIPQIAGLDYALGERIVSRPAAGHRQIFNLSYDPVNNQIIVEISETDAT